MEKRMHRAERIQHGLLILSFMTLVWTGFALRYPDALWAYPLVVWEGSWPVRGVVHRIAGVVMIATSVVHVVTLVVNRKLREHWLHLLPRRNDVREAVAGFAYNVWLRRTAPKISSHSYIEKVEYWAVVWGTVMMGVSGALLWADNFVLSYFPKGLLDVAGVFHYYEAVLAALAILVWHFYAVIFDPAVYPMNLAWLTGYGPVRAGSTEPPPAAAHAGNDPRQGVSAHERQHEQAGHAGGLNPAERGPEPGSDAGPAADLGAASDSSPGADSSKETA
jgi:cytochrome b subunit of formate dehydrogenase